MKLFTPIIEFFRGIHMNDIRVSVNNLNLQVRDNNKDGETIIFLHYSGANIMMWEPVIPYFQNDYRVVLIDLRGHGKSSMSENGYHIDDMASDVFGVMKHLGIDKAHIIGSSMGSEVGLSLAAHHPEYVSSLVCEGALYSEFGPYGIWEGSEPEYKVHVAEKLEQLKNRPDKIYPTPEAVIEAAQDMYGVDEYWNEHFERIERYGTIKIDEAKYGCGMLKPVLEDYMKHYYTYKFEHYYEKLTCPVLMMAPGEVESEQERTVMHDLCTLTKQCKIVEIDKWEHAYGWLIDTKTASETTLNFIRQQGGAQ